ncbi:MAG: hypothetical protein IID41_08585 [Planctomycetes bacterium]|nr:hypothetical protein [Planctomycetota bacterium]
MVSDVDEEVHAYDEIELAQLENLRFELENAIARPASPPGFAGGSVAPARQTYKKPTVEMTDLLDRLQKHVTKLVGEEPWPPAENEAWSNHALSYAVGRVEAWTGIDKEILRDVARRVNTSAGLQPWKRVDGTVWDDLLYVLPKLRKLDKDGSTAELVGELHIQYPDVMSEIGLQATSKKGNTNNAKTRKRAKTPGLTRKQKDLLDYLHAGGTQAEAATHFERTPGAISSMRSRIRKKTDELQKAKGRSLNLRNAVPLRDDYGPTEKSGGQTRRQRKR